MNNGRKGGHFEFNLVKNFKMHPHLKSHISFHSNGHSLPNIGHVKVNNGLKGGHFEFDRVEFF